MIRKYLGNTVFVIVGNLVLTNAFSSKYHGTRIEVASSKLQLCTRDFVPLRTIRMSFCYRAFSLACWDVVPARLPSAPERKMTFRWSWALKSRKYGCNSYTSMCTWETFLNKKSLAILWPPLSFRVFLQCASPHLFNLEPPCWKSLIAIRISHLWISKGWPLAGAHSRGREVKIDGVTSGTEAGTTSGPSPTSLRGDIAVVLMEPQRPQVHCRLHFRAHG